MASLVSQPRHSVQTYWKRRNYQRLGSPSRHLRVARLGGGVNQRTAARAPGAIRRHARAARRVVRLRAAVLLLSPARLLLKLRDAYVDAMLELAGGAGRPCAALAKAPSGKEVGALWAKRVPRARQARSGGGDFERRMMEHIYRMAVTPELPGAAAKA